jgi:putative protein-disulfide isomerase
MSKEMFAYPLGDTLIYVGDPMCSWCYGFTPELQKIKEAFPNVHFKMIMGGLRAHGEESMEDLSGFLWKHWQEVQIASGQKFNFAILKSSNFYYDTEPACRSVCLARVLFPEKEYAYFTALQYAFYHDNLDPTEIETYLKVLKDLHLDSKEFEKQFEKQETKESVEQDFQTAAALQANGFPSLIAIINGKYYKASSGYQKAAKIINLLKDKGMK